jgi:hypothetical protein
VRVPLNPPPTERVHYRLQSSAVHGLIPETESFQGFTVYRNQQVDGSMKLMAPDLDFFPLLTQNRSGYRREISNVELLEPDASFFVPPPGVKIVEGKKPLLKH